MVNELLGAVQTEAVLADSVKLDDDARHKAGEEQLAAAGAGVEEPVRRAEFIRWQVLRATTPLWLMDQNEETGPIPSRPRTPRPGCTRSSA
ncbi:hypothetical protein Strvi_6379 [Streptomyces violaceusniger Tu 4113]|uniref:Uncharacterized protein n=1 Tax=Streptomyces violaceusniger (strain Tu 4113) TaxID=653045 RepID=G2P829_STRV4|nr:hypothetical protein Strvi_6379 [Streptomyces violaceusniger Tu 4113]